MYLLLSNYVVYQNFLEFSVNELNILGVVLNIWLLYENIITLCFYRAHLSIC